MKICKISFENHSYLSGFLLCLVILVVAIVCSPLLYFGMVLDDYAHLSAFSIVKSYNDFYSMLKVVLTNPSGPLGRPVAVASFFISDFTFPTIPYFHRLINLYIHLINCILLAWIAFLITNKIAENTLGRAKLFRFALLGLLFWAVNPINSGPLVSIVQRMTSLSAMFGFCSVVVYLKWRLSKNFLVFYWAALSILLISIFLALSCLSKETGYLFLGYLLIVECFLISLGVSVGSRYWCYFLKFVCFWYLFLIIAINLYYVWFDDSWAFRDFTVAERLMAQLVIVPNYAYKFLTFQISNVGLVAGGVSLSEWFSFGKIVFSMVFWSFVVLVFIKGKNVYRLLVLLYLNGHLLESGAVPLELYFEHRNYICSIALAIIQAVIVYKFISKARIVLVPAVLSIVTVFVIVFFNNRMYQDPVTYTAYSYSENQNSERAIVGIVDVLIASREFEKARQFINLTSDFTKSFLLLQVSCESSQPPFLMPDFSKIDHLDAGVVSKIRGIVSWHISGECSLDSNELISRLSSVIESKSNSKYFSQLIYFEIATLYSNERNLNGAITTLDKAIDLLPGSYLFARKAAWLNSAGLFEEAIVTANEGLKAKSTCKFFRAVCDLDLKRQIEIAELGLEKKNKKF